MVTRLIYLLQLQLVMACDLLSDFHTDRQSLEFLRSQPQHVNYDLDCFSYLVENNQFESSNYMLKNHFFL